ncbi:RmlC-like cupin domain-containing protein [Aspergillus pseudoustus]|uniref:RmlC-like cupin domain-containing protein n=1 Tax=Aspergillus pseudoustus TaxID=1810923 RepID=A0ABR4JPV2_9EURO
MRFITTISLLAGTALAIPTGPSTSTSVPAPSTTPSANIDDLLPPIVPVNPRSGNEELIQKLILAPTQQDRAKLLNEPGDFIFDFNEAGAPESSEAKGLGGFSIAAHAKTMPALIGNGASMTLGFLGPCGMNTAHVHNRATELNVVVKGRLVTNFVLENGAKPVENTLSLYQMAAFPQGAIHQEFNPDCEDTVFVAGFNSADPGVSQVAQNFFSLRGDVVQATLGGIQTLNGQDLESFREMIPANIALGIEACLAKCGLQKNAKRSVNELL